MYHFGNLMRVTGVLKQVLFSKDARETPVILVLQAAATIWHDGNDDITSIDELGGHGGNATVLLRGLALRYRKIAIHRTVRCHRTARRRRTPERQNEQAK